MGWDILGVLPSSKDCSLAHHLPSQFPDILAFESVGICQRIISDGCHTKHKELPMKKRNTITDGGSTIVPYILKS